MDLDDFSPIILELNKVYHEDCLNLMHLMPFGFVDNIITSPPYNIGYNNMNGEDVTKYNVHNDKETKESYQYWLFERIDEMLRITKKHIFFNIQMLGNNKETVLNLMGKYSKKIKDIIIWDKNIAPPHIEPGIISSKFEFIIILSNQSPEKKKFYDGNFKGNFFNVLKGINASQNKFTDVNKATFPEYLPKTILKYFGEKGELIYDPFSGTGTTFSCCIEFGRNFIGSEIDEEQIKLTNERIKEKLQQQKFLTNAI